MTTNSARPSIHGSASLVGISARFTLLPATWVVLLLGAAFLTAGPVLAADPDPGLERDLVALTNVDRTSNGLSALVEDPRLTDVARVRSDDMLVRNYFSHDIPPNGEKFFDLLDRADIPFMSAGENLESNNAKREGSVQFAQKDFMNSPSHRANILRDVYTRIGAGAIPGGGKVLYTVLFMLPSADDSFVPPALAGGAADSIGQTGAVDFTVNSVVGTSLNIPGLD